jgi:hypothetical protein
LDGPVGLAGHGIVSEDFPAIEHHDHDEEAQSSVGGVGLELGVEGSVGARDPLSVTGLAEAEERDEDGDPGEEGGDGCELWLGQQCLKNDGVQVDNLQSGTTRRRY